MIEQFESQFFAYIQSEMNQDPAHDIHHISRVVKSAKSLCQSESAKLAVVLPAAYLHDCFSLPKNHPERAKSSELAAEKANQFLQSIGYPKQHLDEISHAIIAHSFSANVKPRTLEAQIVQDADRLDALGAIGIVRCIQVSVRLGVELYNDVDPFCVEREPNDRHNTVDHFYVKLLKLADTMNTRSARIEATKRTEFMKAYLRQLAIEV